MILETIVGLALSNGVVDQQPKNTTYEQAIEEGRSDNRYPNKNPRIIKEYAEVYPTYRFEPNGQSEKNNNKNNLKPKNTNITYNRITRFNKRKHGRDSKRLSQQSYNR